MPKKGKKRIKRHQSRQKSRLKSKVFIATLLLAVFTSLVMDLESGITGYAVSTPDSRAKIESYFAPLTSITGEVVKADVLVNRNSNAFDYGLVECKVTDWDGNVDTKKTPGFIPKCVELPKSNSFTLNYYFLPLQEGYYRIEYCKVSVTEEPDCNGPKISDLKREDRIVSVYD